MTAAVIVAIVSTSIAACSLGYTVYDKRRGLSKRLRWALMTDTTLMPGLDDDHLDKLSVHWDGNVVRRPRLVSVILSNAGRVELKKGDISVLPRIELSSSKILSADVVLRTRNSTRQSKIDPARVSDTMIEAPALVLNPEDMLVFSLLLDGNQEQIELTMQAAGFTLHRVGEVYVEPIDRARFSAETGIRVVTVLTVMLAVTTVVALASAIILR